MTDIFKTLQNDIIKLAKSQETNFLPLVKSVYGDTPEAVLKGALFASYIYKEDDKEQTKILLECDGELKARGSHKHIKQFNQMFPNVSKKNNTTKTAQSTPEPQIVLTEEIYKANLENSVRTKELELRELHNEEKAVLQAQIYELNNRLTNLPTAFQEAQERIASLELALKREGNEIGDIKLSEAQNALEKGDFSKADKLFTEIEAREKLAVQRSARAAFARGQIAEQQIRWKDAAEHFARAAHLEPNFNNLIMAQKLFYNIGDYDSALSLGLKAEKAAIKEYGEESEQHANSLNNLAETYQIHGQYKNTELFLERAIKIYKEIFGENHARTSNSINNLGSFYFLQKEYKKSENYLNDALKIRLETLGENHFDTATSLNNLGALYYAQRQFNKAEPIYDKALKITRQLKGENHPSTAISLRNLAGLYCGQRKYEDAKPLYLQAIKTFETTLGDEHPLTKQAKEDYKKLKRHFSNT